MYMGIDIGGTKTLVAALSDRGEISESIKFPTPKDYDEFVKELGQNVAKLTTKDFRAGCVASPGSIDRQRGIAKNFGNLPWRNVHLQRDAERITNCPMLIENDANLAGLSEAMLLKDKHAKVLYITVSTGIGTGFIVNQRIDPSLADIEGGQMMLQRGDSIVKWESFASGKAIFTRYGKKASEITDQATWQTIAVDLSVGFIDLLAVTQPDVVVVGGGVGRYLDRFHNLLVTELQKYATPLVPIPPILPAQRPDEAVIYGCYDFAKAHHA
jgi:predicted NBD/HSP70 family sugar kinase